MQISRQRFLQLSLGLFTGLLFPIGLKSATAQPDPLPSWKSGSAKTAIVNFVNQVTTKGSPNFVAVDDRIATFDNDGTLWSEQPAYFQLLFAIDRVKALAPQHPEWKTQQPFKAVLENDWKTLGAMGEKGVAQLIAATHAGMTPAEFAAIVNQWIATARHPRFNRPYTDLVFQPMLELLTYLRRNGFKTYIVSGGGIEFMRAWTQSIYGIPPEQVIGSTIKMDLQDRNGVPVLIRQGELEFIDDKQGKPININKFIGRRPIAAFGNSDGDLQMLQWTAAQKGPSFNLIVHHTDAQREWAYDRQSPFGRLDQALDQATQRGWTVVDMQRDWQVIYPFQQQPTR